MGEPVTASTRLEFNLENKQQLDESKHPFLCHFYVIDAIDDVD